MTPWEPDGIPRMEMGWKNSSELTEIVKDQTTIRYRYDKEGMRNRKYLSDGTTVLYQVQDGQIIGEQHLREDQEKPLYEMIFSYDADGTLFSMNCDGKDYYYILNPTGDVIALVDTGWNTVVSYAYDSWGKVTAIEGDQDLGKKNPLRYRGYYWDEETGLYYLASRYYDPEVGRFISADTIEVLKIQENFDDLNLYSYCNNNSVNYKDPNGNLAIAAGYVVLAAFVVSYVYIASIKNGLRSTKGYTYSIKRINLRKKLSSKNISLSKGGKQRIRDSGLKGVSDQEIARRARDKSLSNKERSRYKREEKARELRNQKKRKNMHHSK